MKSSKLVFVSTCILLSSVCFLNFERKVYSSEFNVVCKENENKEKFEIENLSHFINLYSDKEYNDLVQEIYSITDFICQDYPNHKNWFFEKHLPEVGTGLREVFFVRSEFDSVVAVCFVKNSDIEKKICTLYVSPEFEKRGIGTQLIDRAIELLGTTTPLITFAEYKKAAFESIIRKYGWELTEEIIGCYNDEHTELVYNGHLNK